MPSCSPRSGYREMKQQGFLWGSLRVGLVSLLFGGTACFALYENSLIVLGVLIFVYFVLQLVSAIANQRHMKRLVASSRQEQEQTPTALPTVGIVMVGYRENPDYWDRALRSIAEFAPQTRLCRIIAMVACIDGDDLTLDGPMQERFHSIFPPHAQLPYIHCSSHLLQHAGKRHAMTTGIRITQSQCDPDYLIMMDSDTYVRGAEAFDNLILTVHKDASAGCGTSQLRIFNFKDSLLTRIIAARYLYAFMIERGALSAWKCMTCCSGPFSVYRSSCLTYDLLQDFLQQKHCDQLVGPGDDRHLTLLVMLQGFRSVQTSEAKAYTETPSTLQRFLQQQLRWARSFYREQYYQIGACGQQSWYLTVVTAYEWFFPLIVIMSFLPIFPLTPTIFVHRFFLMFFVVLVRTLTLFCMHHFKWSVFYNILMAPLFFIFLLPMRLYAISTLHIQHWVTSTRDVITPSRWSFCAVDCIGLAAFILLWNALVVTNGVLLFWHAPAHSISFSMDSWKIWS